MSKKISFLFISGIILIVIFIFIGTRYKKHVIMKIPKRLPKKTEFFKKKSQKIKESKQTIVKPLDEISLEEIGSLENTAPTPKKEEFDLTPSPQDLIKMKKDKIRAY